MKENNGGYEPGYQSCDCFWGSELASLVKTLALELGDFKGLKVLDAGCGEGKNAAFLAERGASVTAGCLGSCHLPRQTRLEVVPCNQLGAGRYPVVRFRLPSI